MTGRIKILVQDNPMIKWLYYNLIKYRKVEAKRSPWKSLFEDSDLEKRLLSSAAENPRILMATCTGNHGPAVEIESLLSVALMLRGAKVHALLCDRFLPACLLCEIGKCITAKNFAKNGPIRRYCKQCYNNGSRTYNSARIEVHSISSFIAQQDLDETDEIVNKIPFEQIKSYQYHDLSVGEHAVAGALRFFAKGSISDEPFASPVLRRYLKASILTAIALKKMHNRYRFNTAVFHHGIYVPHGIIGETLRKENVRVVNWNIGYRPGTFIFSHNDTYHHTMMTEPVDRWESIQWNTKLEQRLLNYIQSRTKGTRDWHVFLNEPTGNINQLGLDPGKPTIGLLTNVCWDAQLHYPANVFENMLQWISSTIEFFIKKPELQLAIRVHPAEVTAELPSRQLVVEEIKKVFPTLPSNIYVVAPESKINTYTLMDTCDTVIIYGTKTGVELTSLGIPVIVAGEAWIRNKGITIDPSTQSDYFDLLDTLPLGHRMSAESKQRARKYAYHFFFRKMIPIELIRPTDGHHAFECFINRFEDLMPNPNRNPGLEVICDGVLTGKDFIFEDERLVS